jgi:mono/diheme cytochrome c family protein
LARSVDRSTKRLRLARCVGLAFCAACLAVGCHDDMYNQPRYEPLEESDFFDDGRASRPLPPGTVSFQAPFPADAMQSGIVDGQLVDSLPVNVDRRLLERGRERFDIYCSVCHARTGEGDGMIVERGFRRPPTFHSDRLRGVPIGHFFDVMTNGFGAMPSYASQVAVDDRWAIAAYVRTLQLSQHAAADQLPVELRERLEEAPTP